MGASPVNGEEPVATIQGQRIKGHGSCHGKRKDFHTFLRKK